MTGRDELLRLAARVEALTGPCRETDAAIAVAVMPELNLHQVGDDWHCRHEVYSGPVTISDFTASLDAAMTLVPEGCTEWHAGRHWQTRQGQAYLFNPREWREPIYRLAATPALALTAAALRACAEQAPLDNPASP